VTRTYPPIPKPLSDDTIEAAAQRHRDQRRADGRPERIDSADALAVLASALQTVEP
jgi:hypothetical protein